MIAARKYMSRLSKFQTGSIVVVFLFACNVVTRPATPTAEATSKPAPFLNPRGTPVQEWKGIPIMPQATAGQEFIEMDTYSFEAKATIQDVQNFYTDAMRKLNWSPMLVSQSDENGAVMVYQKDNRPLTITILVSKDSIVVMLQLA